MLEWYYWKTDDFFTNGNFHNVLIGSFPGGDSSWCSTWTESPENWARTSSPLCCCPPPCPWSPTLHLRLDLGKNLFREVFTGEVLPSTRLTLWDQQPSFWEQNCYFNYINDLWQRPLVNNGHYFCPKSGRCTQGKRKIRFIFISLKKCNLMNLFRWAH